jgi:hypothetical protein
MLLAKEPANRPSDIRRIEDILSPSTELDDSQRTLQLVAARVADRKSQHETLSREAARFKQTQTVARQEFSETWNELRERARAVDPDATVSNQGDNWFLECLDGRFSAELIRQTYGAKALWLGQLVVRASEVDAASLVGNVDCVAGTSYAGHPEPGRKLGAGRAVTGHASTRVFRPLVACDGSRL